MQRAVYSLIIGTAYIIIYISPKIKYLVFLQSDLIFRGCYFSKGVSGHLIVLSLNNQACYLSISTICVFEFYIIDLCETMS